ncbi:MAG: hypothetical protein KJ650_03025 [Firmicutes bacterium]|nr:hypothetical protein [Bacillota bacterium]MBU4554183.1 hypothetical protein [Bacillota bacterium]MBV1728546.1 hypothetical protein [Desulforudis sp.]MBV1736490.1 hypothetical protein [Desulforudis sp.]MBV1769813.1 hypothetical protein [Desulforudis sp.]
MLPFDVVTAFVLGIPECLAIVFMVYALLGLRTGPARIVGLGLLFLSLVYIVRNSGAPFPAHALFSFVVMSVTISTWERIALQRVILAWAFTLILVAVLETVLSTAIVSAVGLPVDELKTQPLLLALVPLPNTLVVVLIAWRLYRRGGIRPFRERQEVL